MRTQTVKLTCDYPGCTNSFEGDAQNARAIRWAIDAERGDLCPDHRFTSSSEMAAFRFHKATGQVPPKDGAHWAKNRDGEWVLCSVERGSVYQIGSDYGWRVDDFTAFVAIEKPREA